MTAYSRPIPAGPVRDGLIECFVGMGSAEDGGWFTAHAMFIRKVLRESWATAFEFAARLRNTPLNAEAAHLLCADWEAECL